MSAASKVRQPRLRASCDGCFLAKVKCSKARPICSRCLACGLECRYSPSSRAGKPKSENANNNNNNSNNNNSNSVNSHVASHVASHHGRHQASSMPDLTSVSAAAMTHNLSPIPDEKTFFYSTASALYKFDENWQTAPGMNGHPNGSIPRNPPIASDLVLLSMDDGASLNPMYAAAPAVSTGDIYTSMPWTPPMDMAVTQFGGSSMPMAMPMGAQHQHHRSPSFDLATSAPTMPWIDPTMVDMLAYSQSQMPTPGSMTSSPHTYFPSPSATPNQRHSPTSGHKMMSSGTTHSKGGSSGSSGSGSKGHAKHHSSGNNNSCNSCTCFSTCLHSLQALHNASMPDVPSFDVVLTLNRKAVEGCAAMLACSRCMNRSGTHTAAMLLGTVLGKITSFYKHASRVYFDKNGIDAVMGPLGACVAGGASGGAGGAGSTGGAGSGGGAGGASSISGGHVTAVHGEADNSAGFIPSSYSHPYSHAGTGALATGLGVSLGQYQLQGEDGRWLELEILNHELRKLEEVYSRFREVCGDLSEDVDVSNAMLGYLGQTLGSTLDLVNHRRKSDLRSA